jgi:hypothetical protein
MRAKMKAKIISNNNIIAIIEKKEKACVSIGVSEKIEPQFDIVRKVFKHGSEKHDEIDDSFTQMEHLKKHFRILSQHDTDSGLPNTAHAAARALLLFYSLMREIENGRR